MAIPSSKYAVDSQQTLSNNAVIKYTKTIQELYPGVNIPMDLSIAMTDWEFPAIQTVYRKFQWSTFYDHTASKGQFPDQNTLYLGDWYRENYPSSGGLYQGVILTTRPSNDARGCYATGVSEGASSVYTQGTLGNQKIVVDMDVNKMLFGVTFNGYKYEDWDFSYNDDPTASHKPSTRTITLKELKEHPNDYEIESLTISGAWVCGDNDEWVSGQRISPAWILSDGGAHTEGITNYNYIFLGQSGSFSFSYANANGHPGAPGGNTGYLPYNMAGNNCVLFDTSFSIISGAADAATLKSQLTGTADSIYGTDANYSHAIYYENEIQVIGYHNVHLLKRATVSYNKNADTHSCAAVGADATFTVDGVYALAFVASCGLYFLNESVDPNSEGIRPNDMGHYNTGTGSHVYLGVMNSSGRTTGEWTDDFAHYTGPNKDGKINKEGYTPGGGGGGSDEDDYANMGLGVPGNGLGGLTKYAILTRSEMLALVTDFNTNSQTGNQFSNHIICCYKLGVHSSLICSTTPGNIVLFRELIQGETTSDFTSAASYSLVDSQEVWIDCGGFDVPRMTNTFYDFSPYSSYELFIPCCGWINLPDVVAGRSIRVYLLPDLPTCSCKGVVRIFEGNYQTNAGTTIATVNGILGSSVPFSIFENGLMKSATLSGAVQVMGGTGMVGTALATGNVGLGVSGVSTMLQGVASTYVAGNTNYTATKGGATDYSVFGDGYNAVLKINSPVLKIPSNFGHTVGYMCNKTGKLSTFSGFTICSNPHIDISATSREKEEIKRLLEEGVIL